MMSNLQKTIREFDVLESLVRQIMSREKATRDDDKLLLLRVWEHQGIKFEISDEELSQLSTPESISRCRRKIQNHPLHPELLGNRQQERIEREKNIRKMISEEGSNE